MNSSCCGAHVRCWHTCDGADTTWCDDCGEETCSKCAHSFEVDGGYGDDGQDVHVHAICKDCAGNQP